jgi:hypothetical protein
VLGSSALAASGFQDDAPTQTEEAWGAAELAIEPSQAVDGLRTETVTPPAHDTRVPHEPTGPQNSPPTTAAPAPPIARNLPVGVPPVTRQSAHSSAETAAVQGSSIVRPHATGSASPAGESTRTASAPASSAGPIRAADASSSRSPQSVPDKAPIAIASSDQPAARSLFRRGVVVGGADATTPSDPEPGPLPSASTLDAPNLSLTNGADNSLTPLAMNVGPVTRQVGTASATEAPSAGFAGVANMNVIRGASHAEVTLPGLGLLSVTAHDRDLGVEVRLATSHASATEALAPHSLAMEADLKGANIPVRSVDISSGAQDSASGSPGRHLDAQADGQAPDRGSDKRPPSSPPDAAASPAPSEARVRIVL